VTLSATAALAPPRADVVASRRLTSAQLGPLVWGGLVLAALAVGGLWVSGTAAKLDAAPFYGDWRWHGGRGLVPGIALGAAVVAWGPLVAARWRWSAVVVSTGAAASGWALLLAASDGWGRVTAPLTTRHEYEPLAARVDDLGGFLGGYVDQLGGYPIHVQGHPPGPVVLAWVFDRVGLGGAGWLAALVLVAWGVAVTAALATARALGGEAAARRAAPAMALLPAAIWAGTSMDAVFAALIAGTILLAVLAATRASPRLAVVAGAAVGTTLLFTYGAVAPLLITLAVVPTVSRTTPFSARRERREPGGTVPQPASVLTPIAAVRRDLSEARGTATLSLVGAAGAGALVPLGVAAAAGFWWTAGLAATGQRYWAGVASQRPAVYLTLIGNPAVLALAVGPAVAVGLWQARGTAARLLPLAALAAVSLADLSQMSRGEVERIWLPFVPWLALAAPGDSRRWLAAQGAVALTLQATLVSAW